MSARCTLAHTGPLQILVIASLGSAFFGKLVDFSAGLCQYKCEGRNMSWCKLMLPQKSKGIIIISCDPFGTAKSLSHTHG